MEIKELKKIWQEIGFRPGKSLGQNFLIDKNVRDKIISFLSLTPQEVVLEIGPGFGAMTFELASRSKKVIAVDKDKRICDVMSKYFLDEGNIELICDDILKTDIESLIKGKGKAVLYGNIPYYITTPIIEKIIDNKEHFDRAYLVIQDEVATRICSKPGPKEYGSLSLFVQYYFKVKKVFKIKKNSFKPVPKVDSALLSLEVLDEPSVKVKDKRLMFDIIHKAFSQRRKKILNPLSHNGFLGLDKESWKDIFDECKIDIAKRAEDLSLKEYAQLADKVQERT